MKKRMLAMMLAGILVLSLGGVAQAQTPEAVSAKPSVAEDVIPAETPTADVSSDNVADAPVADEPVVKDPAPEAPVKPEVVSPVVDDPAEDEVVPPVVEEPSANEVIPEDAPVDDNPEFVPGEVPAEVSISEAMTPAIHGMMLAMFHYDATHFDSADSVMTWEALYNMLSLYGQMDERSEYVEDCLVFPAEVVADFSTVLTDDFFALGELPDELADRMTYDPATDCYRVVCGNDELAEVRVDNASPDTVSGALIYVVDDEVLSSFTADLHPADNLFGFAITDLVLK